MCICRIEIGPHIHIHIYIHTLVHNIFACVCFRLVNNIYIAGSLTSATALHITWVGEPIVITFLSLDQIIEINRITSSAERKNRKIRYEF